MRNSRFKITVLMTLLLAAGFTSFVHAQAKYYRYINDKGVRVINSTIPPQYVGNGYEIVTIHGDVLETIAPAPSEDELAEVAAKREREAQLKEWEEALMRRYSSVADIEAAKKRKIADFDGAMSILRGNANNINTKIEDMQARAAGFERTGKAVPAYMLDNLVDLKRELTETQKLIDSRLEEQKALEQKFDEDIEKFKQVQAAKSNPTVMAKPTATR